MRVCLRECLRVRVRVRVRASELACSGRCLPRKPAAARRNTLPDARDANARMGQAASREGARRTAVQQVRSSWYDSLNAGFDHDAAVAVQ
eukprot:4008904-Pleurochrysis_carterae.AAC.1